MPVSDEHTKAREAIFGNIARVANESGLKDWNPDLQAKTIRDLAVAFRLAAGGAQPGSSIIDHK